uniref:Uncharacterized protein n=1 Tax=Rhizophora mucronata TaxID=61149 RepID=A0A2P2PNJ2_RHIMU
MKCISSPVLSLNKAHWANTLLPWQGLYMTYNVSFITLAWKRASGLGFVSAT